MHSSTACICVSALFRRIKPIPCFFVLLSSNGLFFAELYFVPCFRSTRIQVCMRTSDMFVCFSSHLFGSKDNIISKSEQHGRTDGHTTWFACNKRKKLRARWLDFAVEAVVRIGVFNGNPGQIGLIQGKDRCWVLPLNASKQRFFDLLCVWCDSGHERPLSYRYIVRRIIPTVGV